jgi:hypothetical protein
MKEGGVGKDLRRMGTGVRLRCRWSIEVASGDGVGAVAVAAVVMSGGEGMLANMARTDECSRLSSTVWSLRTKGREK